MQMDPLQALTSLTSEINLLISKEQTVTSGGHEYKNITQLIDEHKQKVQLIFKACVGHPELLTELSNYSASINKLKALLPPLGEKVTNVAQLKLLSIRKKINETQAIHKIAGAFKLNESDIIDFIKKSTPLNLNEHDIDGIEGNSLEPFFVKAADVCFNLANQRLSKPQPFDSEEITAICEALFDPHIVEFNQKKESNHPISQPHPHDVFKNLHTFFNSVEQFNSCEQIGEQVKVYLDEKPIPQISLSTILNLPKPRQARILDILREQAADGEERAKIVLDDLKNHQDQLNDFKNGLKYFPLINVRTLLEESVNVNQTFFLNVDGKTKWVFKPSSGNEQGARMVQAECTAARLNYHHQFPIPLTIELIIKDWQGSAQLYIENAQTLAQVKGEGTLIAKNELQKLVIFDLLFANSDRNNANFLFQIIDGEAKIIGIDHDRCLMTKDIGALKYEYLGLEILNEPLEEGVAELFSNQALADYTRIMQENMIPNLQSQWVHIVAAELNEALISESSLNEVIRDIQQRYDEEYFS